MTRRPHLLSSNDSPTDILFKENPGAALTPDHRIWHLRPPLVLNDALPDGALGVLQNLKQLELDADSVEHLPIINALGQKSAEVGDVMSEGLTRYLDMFVAKAHAAALPVRKRGQNWVPLAPLARGSHVSLSVAAHQIQVNLNNDDDADRSKFERLSAYRPAIHAEIGEGLLWDQKEGRKKTVIRATMDKGYDDEDWDAQHHWALTVMQRFEAAFAERLG